MKLNRRENVILQETKSKATTIFLKKKKFAEGYVHHCFCMGMAGKKNIYI